MAIPILIIGQSGTGKSASLRNFSPDEVAIVNVARKPLPFKNKCKMLNTDDYQKIENAVKKTERDIIVIDDCQYLMANEFMRTAKQTGFQKFTDIALNFFTLIQVVIKELPANKRVYFLGHTELNADNTVKFKTIGKLLDEKITIEGLFTIVLKTCVNDKKFSFSTINNGADTVKSPIGMFENDFIDNDLKLVDDTIKKYYGLEGEQDETNSDAE